MDAKIDELIIKAKNFATICHFNQKRKYTNAPYIIHPASVAALVEFIGKGSSEMIAASWLHDVIEDCNVTIEYLINNFNANVAYLVEALTEYPNPNLNRKKRKEIQLKKFSLCNGDVHTIKLADLIDNTCSIVMCDPKFAKIYLKEKEDLLKVLNKGNADLYRLAEFTLKSSKNFLYYIDY